MEIYDIADSWHIEGLLKSLKEAEAKVTAFLDKVKKYQPQDVRTNVIVAGDSSQAAKYVKENGIKNFVYASSRYKIDGRTDINVHWVGDYASHHKLGEIVEALESCMVPRTAFPADILKRFAGRKGRH